MESGWTPKESKDRPLLFRMLYWRRHKNSYWRHLLKYMSRSQSSSTYQKLRNTSVKVSAHVKSANIIQYIIHFTWNKRSFNTWTEIYAQRNIIRQLNILWTTSFPWEFLADHKFQILKNLSWYNQHTSDSGKEYCKYPSVIRKKKKIKCLYALNICFC